MALETQTILRSVLYQVYTAETLEQARIAIEAMCRDEDIAVAEKKAQAFKEIKEKQA